MELVSINMKTVITLKAFTLRMKKEDMEVTILPRGESLSHSSIPFHLKYLKSFSRMVQFMSASSATAAERVQAKQLTWMEVSMMANGVKTASMAWVNSNTWTRHATMVSGRAMCAKVMGLTTTQMGTDMRVTGIVTFKTALALTII